MTVIILLSLSWNRATAQGLMSSAKSYPKQFIIKLLFPAQKPLPVYCPCRCALLKGCYNVILHNSLSRRSTNTSQHRKTKPSRALTSSVLHQLQNRNQCGPQEVDSWRTMPFLNNPLSFLNNPLLVHITENWLIRAIFKNKTKTVSVSHKSCPSWCRGLCSTIIKLQAAAFLT